VVLVVDPVNKYGVFGIIQRIINEKSSVEGAVSEEKILSEITRAIQKAV
jgi:hypothetical protein